MHRKIARLQAPLTLTILCAPARNPDKLLGSKREGGIMEIGRRQGSQSTGSRQRLLRVAAIVALLAAFAGGVGALATVGGGPNWGMIGNDATNTRNQPNEHSISPANVSRLALKWVATTAGDVSATPAVVDGAVYFGDFGGKLWKLDADTGQVIWSRSVADYTGIAGDIVRTSPSVAGNTLVVGD